MGEIQYLCEKDFKHYHYEFKKKRLAICFCLLIGRGIDVPDYAATLKKIDETLANVKILTEKLNSKDNTIGLLFNDPTSYNNLNATTENAASLLEDLKEHPKRYVHFSLFGKKDE